MELPPHLARLKCRLAKGKGYTLIELLVVIAIVVVLLVLTYNVALSGLQHANCARSAANMHSLTTGFYSYSQDNGGLLPGRVTSGNKWPILIYPYVNSVQCYVDPGDPVAAKIPLTSILVNSPNNSSYIFNGFNDLGFYSNPSATVTWSNIPNPANTFLLAQQIPGGNNFYLDLQDGDQNQVLKKTAYFGGSNYAFCDLSVHFVPLSSYSDTMWEVNQNYVIPTQTH